MNDEQFSLLISNHHILASDESVYKLKCSQKEMHYLDISRMNGGKIVKKVTFSRGKSLLELWVSPFRPD